MRRSPYVKNRNPVIGLRFCYCAIKTIDEVCKYSYFSQTSLFAQQKPNVLFGIFTGLIKFQHICTYRVHKLLITKSHISTHEVVMWDFFAYSFRLRYNQGLS